ncbi:MAG: hypothetical protein EOP58_04310 [Sphingomonadales bacterium]|nr:MAG: hypothetical protein EOP58_04310 [Sphingomonadales bacterium]
MPTRYEQLRKAVSVLAAPAAEQAAHLDHLFSALVNGGSAAAYGNDELALELDDIFVAANDMIECGELTEHEAALIRPLNTMLGDLSGKQHADFWLRNALADDPRWVEVRALAAAALKKLPIESRDVGMSAPHGS